MEAAPAASHLPARLRARSFERECEALRPLGEAYLLRHFGPTLGRADAEDAVAEVLIRLHRKAATGEVPRNLRAAFFTSVRNAAIDQLRSRAAKPTVALEAAAEVQASNPSPAELAESREDAVRLQEALGRMRGNYREAILLRFGLGMSVPEIARYLGISLPAAKKLVLRSTAQVRSRIEAIDAAEFCPEMRERARRSLFEKQASGLASGEEAETLRAHLRHCGTCRSFLSELRDSAHGLGAAAVLGLPGERLGVLAHLGGWARGPLHLAQAALGRLRHLAYRAGGALPGSDAGSAGAALGTGQKLAAICTAGAAGAATCLLSGAVGPGIGATISPHSPPPKVRHVSHRAKPAPAPRRPRASSSTATETAPAPEAPSTSTDARDQDAEVASPEALVAPAPATPAAPSETTDAPEFGVESRAPTSGGEAPPSPSRAAGSGGDLGGAGTGGAARGSGAAAGVGFQG